MSMRLPITYLATYAMRVYTKATLSVKLTWQLPTWHIDLAKWVIVASNCNTLELIWPGLLTWQPAMPSK